MYPLIFLGLAIFASAIHIFLSKDKSRGKIVEIFFIYLMVFCVGAQGVFAAMGHIFMANEVAREIGWPTGSPFQFEVGVANLGIGIAALAGIFFRGYYLFGPLITYVIFLYGDAWGHLNQLAKGDTSPYNSGVFLYVGDILIPTIVLIFGILYYYLYLRPRKIVTV